MTYWRVSASCMNWYFIIFVMIWRQVLKSNRVQKALHRPLDGKLAVAFQWYSLFFAGVLCMMIYSIWELTVSYSGLSEAEVDGFLEDTYNYNVKTYPDLLAEKFGKDSVAEVTFEEFKKPLQLDIYLRVLSIMSFIIGIPVVLVAAYHTSRLVFKGAIIADQDSVWSQFPFKPTRRLDWVLLVIAMPAIFAQASMRATNRMWALMVGKAEGHKTYAWQEVGTFEHALYTNDLEIAALFQFCTVYCFTRLCSSYLTENYMFDNLAKLQNNEDNENEEKKEEDAKLPQHKTSHSWLHKRSASNLGHDQSGSLDAVEDFKLVAEEFKRVIRGAAFLGVWAFISFGLVRCLFDIFMAEIEQDPEWAGVAEKLQDNVLDSMSTVFTALTVLCVINMIIICNLKMIKDKLDAEGVYEKIENANSKFLGTRMLLLLAEVQPKILAAFTVGRSLYERASQFKGRFPVINKWRFSYEQAQLLHSCLLNIECLVVVVWNLITWYHLDLPKSRLMKFKYKASLLDRAYDRVEDWENRRERDLEHHEGEKPWWKEFLHF